MTLFRESSQPKKFYSVVMPTRAGSILILRAQTLFKPRHEQSVREGNTKRPLEQAINKQPSEKSDRERHRPFLFTRQFKIKKHRYRDRVGKPKQPDRDEEANRPDDYRNGSTSSYFRWNISCSFPCRARTFGFLLAQEILNQLAKGQYERGASDNPRKKAGAKAKMSALEKRQGRYDRNSGRKQYFRIEVLALVMKSPGSRQGFLCRVWLLFLFAFIFEDWIDNPE